MADLKKSSDILGKPVSNHEGHLIGSVEELFFDTEWRVTDVQIKVDKQAAKQMGIRKPLFGSLLLLIETAKIKAVTDQVILDISMGDFKSYVEERKASD